MSTVKKEEYYTNNSTINMHIDNIMSFRDFLNAVLSDIKSGEYNIQMIKNLSHTVEKFYNEIGDSEDIFKANAGKQDESRPLTPKAVETYLYSDSDDDLESIATVVSGVGSDISDTPPSRSPYTIGKYFSHNPRDVYNDDPEFLDDETTTTTPHNTPQYNKLQYSPNTINYSNYYSNMREKKVSEYDYYQSLYDDYRQESSDNKQKKNSYALFETNSDDNEKTEPHVASHVTFEKVNIEPPVPPETKPVDKLAQAFLNNNLELNKYHYLKNFNQNNINNFCTLSYIY